MTEPNRATSDEHPDTPCPRCLALERRIEELEARARRVGADAPGGEGVADDRPRLGRGVGAEAVAGRRAWMDAARPSYLCLPMVAANQWGWQVLCPTDVRVTWDGSPGREGLTVEVDPQYAPAVKSQFGSGIVTFSPPWLFRTPPGWDLYAKGPGNLWKAEPGAARRRD